MGSPMDKCARPGYGTTRGQHEDNPLRVAHDCGQLHAFVEPAPASDDEAVVQSVLFKYGADADMGMAAALRLAYRAGFEAGRATNTETADWHAAIKIHIDAANEWRLRFERLLKMFGFLWREGQEVDSLLDDIEAARAQVREDGGK